MSTQHTYWWHVKRLSLKFAPSHFQLQNFHQIFHDLRLELLLIYVVNLIYTIDAINYSFFISEKKHSQEVDQFHSSSCEYKSQIYDNFPYSLAILNQMLELLYCSTSDFFRFLNQFIHFYLLCSQKGISKYERAVLEALQEQSK